MIITDLSNITRVHGGRTIFAGLSWTMQSGEKIGLVGPNGVGKSSLLRIIAGLEPPDAGAITFRRHARVAYLPQEYAGEPGRSVLAELLAARADLAALEERIAALEERMADPALAGDMVALAAVLDEHTRLLDRHTDLGGPALRGRAEALLRELRLDEEHWERPMGQLSGGQRKLVGLARCLLSEPDLLLLDEPDNHLDLERKALLEQIVGEFRGAVVIISHDRYLLDETVDLIVELEPAPGGARMLRWEGNYSAYVAQKELALLRQQADYVAQQKEIARLEEAISRFKLWARIVVNERHIKQARVKQRQIDRMDKVERPVLERRKMALEFRPRLRGGVKAVDLRRVDKGFGERIVLLDAAATIQNGERIGVVGPNGAGKSVLLRIIAGLLEPDGGEVWVGPSIERGYYAQHHETLDIERTPVEALRALRPITEGEAVAKLGRFLIPYAAATQPLARLSGGEKSRVQLAGLMLSGANCLLLDEPTNNLDIPSAEVLEAALEEFPGTVVVVSHDRYFLDRVADRIFALDDGELRVYEGGYSFYAERARPAPPPAAPARPAQPARPAARTNRQK
ncbi:MAG: ABC-F family ATP-binding cassette domain-containing protein, partial [Chloroflexales bacterium]|nr:ABC-F family ATP-binding cassette domain-containing protein [Chloroflexales bacterium]